MVVKFQKINFECITLVMDCKTELCDDFSSVDFIYLIPFFSRIFWIDRVHDLMKRFFPDKDCDGNKKSIFFSYHGNDC